MCVCMYVCDGYALCSVDIAAHPRSKKLRRMAGEVHISGTDYSSRLKAQ